MKGHSGMNHQINAATVVATKLPDTSQMHESVRKPSYAIRQQTAENQQKKVVLMWVVSQDEAGWLPLKGHAREADKLLRGIFVR